MELARPVNLPVDKMSKMHIKIHEDNVGALTQEHPTGKVASSEQLGDIFTKGLSTQPFSYLRSKLVGWMGSDNLGRY
eukprot:scaffold288_cov44-Cyclotella_meneghiniana.AAC.8